jgi:signal transduction histidine kinase
MILHNLFFLLLLIAVWLVLLPLIDRQARQAAQRERDLLASWLTEPHPQRDHAAFKTYQYTEGSEQDLQLSRALKARLDARPDLVEREGAFVFVKAGPDGTYRRALAPESFSDDFVRKSQLALVGVLAVVYVIGVLTLELLVLRLYIYRPLRVLLEADEASRRGDMRRELIDEKLLLGDELGQIMSSRNATLIKLRRHEEDLEQALVRIEQVAADLRQKNYLLETAKQNIANQDRLVSLGLLSASVAHELNTPLAVLHGSIEKLIETVQDSHAQDRLARMLRVTRRLQEMSESLVDFARARRHNFEPVEIQPLIAEAWSLAAIDEKAAGVNFNNRAENQHRVLGNADRLIQLFVNVLRNAVHAVKPGGAIQVRSRRAIVNGAEFVIVAVEDDGPGIPPDVLPDIFEAFVTTRLDARGTGLGLTVAEGIAHQHGGTITASNRPEGGARLEVHIPAASSGV